jgi:hypothetical protein
MDDELFSIARASIGAEHELTPQQSARLRGQSANAPGSSASGAGATSPAPSGTSTAASTGSPGSSTSPASEAPDFLWTKCARSVYRIRG